MTGEQSYRYYNELLWPDRYADCVLTLSLNKDDDTTDF